MRTMLRVRGLKNSAIFLKVVGGLIDLSDIISGVVRLEDRKIHWYISVEGRSWTLSY
jgi:hypothetical protein